MGKIWKVLAGLGVAAATAGVVISLAKKKANEETYDEIEIDDLCEGCEAENCDDCKCDDCACEDDCSECECDEDCCDCDFGDDFEDAQGLDIKDAVNSVIDGVMGGIVVAADKVSELCGKLADTVSNKLAERQDAAMFEMDDCDFDCENCDDESCCGCCDIAEEAAEVVVDACGDVSDAIENVSEVVIDEATGETVEASAIVVDLPEEETPVE